MKASFPQPLLLFTLPSFYDFAWNGIIRTKRNEHDCSGLRPMRPEVFVDQQAAFGIEEFTEHGNLSQVTLRSLRERRVDRGAIDDYLTQESSSSGSTTAPALRRFRLSAGRVLAGFRVRW